MIRSVFVVRAAALVEQINANPIPLSFQSVPGTAEMIRVYWELKRLSGLPIGKFSDDLADYAREHTKDMSWAARLMSNVDNALQAKATALMAEARLAGYNANLYAETLAFTAAQCFLPQEDKTT
ncbi:MAG: hypothetical protein EPN91_02200 [Salinibacterium sp.]|nr:MAG: hypothetical protein EPN91_02200 [Salinibacterium sp.]